MSEKFDLVFTGGTLVTPKGLVAAGLAVKDGKIAAIGSFGVHQTEKTVDCKGLHILPGLIDSQVHFREPGNEHKEDLETGTLAAVMGGVTTIFDMPNTRPATTDATLLADKVARARGRAWCDHAFYLGATAANAGGLSAIENLPGCCGIKIFMGSSTGDLLVPDDETVLKVLKGSRRTVAVHAEDEQRLAERRSIAEGPGGVLLHPLWRDEETALLATTRLLRLAHEAKRRVHVLHVTTAEEMALLAKNRTLASVEVTPQHLTLSAPECYERLGTKAQMNPPVRDQRHQDALWQALRDGVVDVIGSDHAPHTLEEKAKPYPQSPSGMPGVQTILPVMLTHVAAGRLSLLRLVELLGHGPSALFGLPNKGRIAPGCDADLVLVDLQVRRTIDRSWLKSKCGWSPFEGMKVTGFPVATYLRGECVVAEGIVVGRAPMGRALFVA